MATDGTRLSILLQVTVAVVSLAERQEIRRGLSVWIFQDGYQRSCLPMSHCAINHEIRPCLVDGEQDRCVKCPAGKINMDPTNSWSNFPCYMGPVCPEGTVKNPNPSSSTPSSCNPRCQCDPLQGWYGPDSCLCTKADHICGNNTYLNILGHCTGCPEGTHKPGLGYGPCLKVPTDLPTRSTTDPQTVSPMPTTTTTESNSTSDSSDKIDRSAVIDHEIRPCLVDGEQDRCVKCPAGKINMDPTNSWSNFPCYMGPVCPEGTVKNPNPSSSTPSSCNPRCQCDPLQGWYGPDSCLCTKADHICGNNTYLNILGHCTGCSEGTHKPGLGYGPCLKVPTDLPTRRTTDPQTVSPMPTTTTTGSNSTSDSSDKIDRSSVIEPHPKKESDKSVLSNQDRGNPETHHVLTIAIAIAAMCVFIICLVLVVFGLLYRRISAQERNQTFFQVIRNIFVARGRPRETNPDIDSGHSVSRGPQAQLMPGESDSSDANGSQASSVDELSFSTLYTDTGSGSSRSPLIQPVSDPDPDPDPDPDSTQLKQPLAIGDA